MSTWEKLAQKVASGFDPNKTRIEVELTPGQRIRRVKRRPGRPRTRGAVKYGHYAGWQPEKGGRGRPRCRKRGCQRQLRRDQPLACCASHQEEVIAEAKDILQRAAEALLTVGGD